VSWSDLITGIGRHDALLFGDIDDLVQSFIELRGGPATESDRYREELEREFPVPEK
jgi:hypothetical protein